MRVLVIFCFLTSTAPAGEYVVLASGARLHADRHEAYGAKIRLYQNGGFVEMDAAAIRGYEPEENVVAEASPVPLPSPAPVLPVAPPAHSPAELADAAAAKYGLPQWLVRSVMSAESGFEPRAVSSKGAVGLMQLMPATAADLGIDPHDPVQNVDAGTRYLRDLLEKYDGGLRRALAAYNAGPGAVDKYKGVPPYRETVNYVLRIEKDWKKSGGANQ